MATRLSNRYLLPLRKEIYEARSERRGKYHDENRARAKAHRKAQQQAKLAAAINAKELGI